MNRHTQQLQKKSRTHMVELTTNGWIVTSGSSGKQYRVREISDGRFLCGCDWHKYHEMGECSHTAAVRNWIAESGGRKVYLSASVEEYRGKHQRFETYNEGVIYTSRAA